MKEELRTKRVEMAIAIIAVITALCSLFVSTSSNYMTVGEFASLDKTSKIVVNDTNYNTLFVGDYKDIPEELESIEVMEIAVCDDTDNAITLIVEGEE